MGVVERAELEAVLASIRLLKSRLHDMTLLHHERQIILDHLNRIHIHIEQIMDTAPHLSI